MTRNGRAAVEDRGQVGEDMFLEAVSELANVNAMRDANRLTRAARSKGNPALGRPHNLRGSPEKALVT